MSKQRIFNSTLNPNLWDENENLKTEISQLLLKIATDFYEETHINAKLHDVFLLGSSANYNWTPTSDIDIHLVIDTKELGIDEDNIRNFLESLKTKWNYEHDITIKGQNVEGYIQDIDHQTSATGIYSLIRGIWISKPVKERPILDKDLIKSKYDDWVYKLNKVLKNPTVDKIKKVVDDLYKMRQSGLDRAGEFSSENIVFKTLRKRGYVKKLTNLKTQIYDKSVSLK
jgi:predicted nucleotidyltransferase